MAEQLIEIDYCPRRYFRAFHDRSQRWACIVAHRRAGKTTACIHDLLRGALQCSHGAGRFAYVSPLRSQSKQVAWDILCAAIAPLRVVGATAHESELRVDLPNGGQVRLYGADNPDALRGIGLDGIVIDEYSQCRPRVWSEVIRPALSDRKGWAVFIGTPSGHDAFYDVWKNAQSNPEWFSLMLRASETVPQTSPDEYQADPRLLTQTELEAAKRSGMTDEEFEQEYECSFEAAIIGSYYGKLLNESEKTGRICGVPYDPITPVYTAWDIGRTDATAIWFYQISGREIHILDYYENSGLDATDYAAELQSRKYKYGGHILPHDAEPKERGSGKSYIEIVEGMGLKNCRICPNESINQGINAVRTLLPRCWFDKDKCKRGIEALKLYRSDWDEKRGVLKPVPVHDWSSHAADAFRYLAMMLDTIRVKSDFNRKIEYPRIGLA